MLSVDDLSRIYLAGAFGNYINRASARRIGLLDFPPQKFCPPATPRCSAPSLPCSVCMSATVLMLNSAAKSGMPLNERAVPDIFAEEMRSGNDRRLMVFQMS
jgi:hypothetical protein